MPKGIIGLGIVVIYIVVGVSLAQADGVTLAWDPPQGETPVEGYLLYYGRSCSDFSNEINVGNVTQYLISGLQEGITYYFVLKAYNSAGQSPPICYGPWTAPDTTPPMPPTGVTVR